MLVSGSESVLLQVPASSSGDYLDNQGLSHLSGAVSFSIDPASGTPSAPFSTATGTGSFGNGLYDCWRLWGYEGLYRELTDNSKAQVSHRIKAGQRVFDIVSGSIESEADLGLGDTVGEATTSNAYGLFYPDIAVFAFNANAFTSSFTDGGLGVGVDGGAGNLNIGTAYNDSEGDNANTFFDMVKGGYKFQARSEETVTSTHYFCRVKNKQYNFSNNPTFYTASDGSFTNDDFFKNPRTYLTTVGLYNDANELLAVAKLSKPLLKSFDREAVVKVKLDF